VVSEYKREKKMKIKKYDNLMNGEEMKYVIEIPKGAKIR
jgi:hypothetical protein